MHLRTDGLDRGVPVGLIAGRGELPAIGARELRAAGHRVVAVGFDDETVGPGRHERFALDLRQGAAAPDRPDGREVYAGYGRASL